MSKGDLVACACHCTPPAALAPETSLCQWLQVIALLAGAAHPHALPTHTVQHVCTVGVPGCPARLPLLKPLAVRPHWLHSTLRGHGL